MKSFLFACAPTVSPTLTGTITVQGNLVIGAAVIEGALVVTKATSGSTVTIAATTHLQVIEPPTSAPGAIIGATMTFLFPPSPADGQRIEIATTGLISNLTISAPGTTIMNAPTTLSAGNGFEYVYQFASLTWFRVR